MKVLLVNGFAARDAAKFAPFKQAVLSVIRVISQNDVIAPHVIEKPRAELDEYIYEMHSNTADPESITRFDQLDFVFVDGDVSIPPWAPQLHKLCLLVKMCMMTGKCLFGAGFGAAILAYLCSTGGELLQAVNGKGRGTPLRSVQSAPPPENGAIVVTEGVAADINSHIVLLDSETGDYFNFNHRHNTWEPKGNTGLVMHTSDRDKAYGVRPTSARAGTRKPNNHKSPALVAKLGDVQCCGRIEQRTHAYLKGLELSQFVVNCSSRWDLDEMITHTSGNRYKVFVDSQRGPLLIEFGNALCTHFVVSANYPPTCTILKNYVTAKFSLLREREHVDRTYVASITGVLPTSTAKHGGPPKTTGALPASALDQTAKGRTSPKKCKAVAASKPRPFSAAPTTNGRLRSALSHNQSQHEDPPHEVCSLSLPSSRQLQSPPMNSPSKAPVYSLPVHRLTDQEVKKPYCAHTKFEKLRLQDAARCGHGYYSVVNDGPYRGCYEQQVIDDEKGKLKWMGGPFRTTFGRASSREFLDDGVLGAGGPYNVHHTPAYVLEPDRNHPTRKPSTKSLAAL
ncbi:hypothetical protein ACHHYP_01298 [Achlya hypogyna]|uniref:Glutamine amidotransferase domain-containing protein n=1 Tax=Achlya hypogyna TaxID=1202772 RepID=A0A1V9Z8X9_ACHHY|nr:hypothetical protein ACHHYP_01298 [Achlya hypogyna]